MNSVRQGLGLGFFILLLIIILVSTSTGERKAASDVAEEITGDENRDVPENWENPLNTAKLVDNKGIYKEDQDARVDNLYVTVLPPASADAVTFEQLNNMAYNIDEGYVSDAVDPVVEVLFEAGEPGERDVSPPVPNATMEVRGQSARLASQKSYKIKLFDGTEKWLDFQIINLNKHFYDPLRIRNKLSFDYFEMLPDFVSLRTRFVRLYIKDLSSRTPDKEFQYYGLYTFIEQPNKRFLERHNLDKNGHLYKAEYFEFFRYEDAIKVKEDLTYDSNKFEEILEVCGSNDHKKLTEMLEAVNDYSRDINEVVDKYFDRDNLLTWLAVNILFDNYDTSSRNFLLYSPLNSDKWFFIPWDYDGTWEGATQRGKWQKGLSNYWGMALFNRFFKDIDNVEALNRKIEALSDIINGENTRKLLDSYYSAVKDNIYRMPDAKYLEIPESEYKEQLYSLVGLTEQNRKDYFASLENPMPFFLGEPVLQNGSYVFAWDASYDLQGDDLTYNFMLSKDPEFKNIIASYKGLKKTGCSVGDLKPGRYYWKATAHDGKGNWQEAFDQYDGEGHSYYGVRKITIE